jgi:hypothetical protein
MHYCICKISYYKNILLVEIFMYVFLNIYFTYALYYLCNILSMTNM